MYKYLTKNIIGHGKEKRKFNNIAVRGAEMMTCQLMGMIYKMIFRAFVRR